MKQKKKISVRPVRLISYLVLVLLTIVSYGILRSYFLWILWVLLVLAPLSSLWSLRKFQKSLHLSVGIGQERVRCREMAVLELRISNPLWYGALESRILFQIQNQFYDSRSEVQVSMPVQIHRETLLRLPIELQDLGKIRMQVVSFRVQDLLGIFCCEMGTEASCEFCVLPRGKKQNAEQVAGLLAGASESEESKSKGSDFAQVSDIREYIPGDRIRDIHWKLSARQDTWMVKERTAMAGNEMVILLNFSDQKSRTQEMLEFIWGMGKYFVDNRLPVRLLCWNQRNFAFEEFGCGTSQELVQAFEQILQTPVQLRQNAQQERYLKNSYPFLERYLKLIPGEESAQVVICENV